jgi:hypothetical protein
VAEVERWLNERSGLLGLSGQSGDLRDLLAHEATDRRATVVLDGGRARRARQKAVGEEGEGDRIHERDVGDEDSRPRVIAVRW